MSAASERVRAMRARRRKEGRCPHCGQVLRAKNEERVAIEFPARDVIEHVRERMVEPTEEEKWHFMATVGGVTHAARCQCQLCQMKRAGPPRRPRSIG